MSRCGRTPARLMGRASAATTQRWPACLRWYRNFSPILTCLLSSHSALIVVYACFDFPAANIRPVDPFFNVLQAQAGLPVPIVAGASAAHHELSWPDCLAARLAACLIADPAWYAGQAPSWQANPDTALPCVPLARLLRQSYRRHFQPLGRQVAASCKLHFRL